MRLSLSPAVASAVSLPQQMSCKTSSSERTPAMPSVVNNCHDFSKHTFALTRSRLLRLALSIDVTEDLKRRADALNNIFKIAFTRTCKRFPSPAISASLCDTPSTGNFWHREALLLEVMQKRLSARFVATTDSSTSSHPRIPASLTRSRTRRLASTIGVTQSANQRANTFHEIFKIAPAGRKHPSPRSSPADVGTPLTLCATRCSRP